MKFQSKVKQLQSSGPWEHWVKWVLKWLCVVSCVQLCDPLDCNPPGSSIHGIFQARILEQVAISSSRGSSRPRDWIRVSWLTIKEYIKESHHLRLSFQLHNVLLNTLEKHILEGFGPFCLMLLRNHMALRYHLKWNRNNNWALPW